MREVLITGATGGIGEALSELFVEKGDAVTLVGRNEETLRTLQERLAKKGQVRYFICDHSFAEQRAALESYVAKSTYFDLIINNAGFGLYGEAIDLPLHKQQTMVDVNIKALVGLTLVAAETMVARGKQGMIMNVSSLASFFPTPLMTVYGATKAFVTSFSEALDYELRSKGVRVLACCPGMVESAFAEKAAGKALPPIKGRMSSKQAAEEIFWQIVHKQSIHRCGWKAKVTFYLAKLLPRSWQMKIIYKNIRKRI